MPRQADDPREAGGRMAGPGGPHDRGQVTYDSRRAVLVEQYVVSVAHGTSGGRPLPDRVALVVHGRINRPPDDESAALSPAERVEHLHMADWELAADLIANLFALAARDGTDLETPVAAAWAKLAEQGLTTRRESGG